MIIAGEASGDMHAAAVATALRRRRPELVLTGIGGVAMAAAGVTLIERAERLAVMGFVEVVSHIPRHIALLRALRRRLRGGTVALLVLIDYPGLNLKLAAAAAAAGVPVLYYITPQVWAWGAGRLSAMARHITRAAVILPFEEALLRGHGIDASFVGHPLLDRAIRLEDRAAARNRLGVPLDVPLLALFPGSRKQEIAQHLTDFLAIARELEHRHPGLRAIISVAPEIELPAHASAYPLVHDASLTVLRAADAALCKSGTTTLEAAVAGCPLVVAYRTSRWTYALARRLVTIPHIGLVNVVAGREVAREFVQHAIQPALVSDAIDPLLALGSLEREQALRDLAEVRAKLGTPGAAERVAVMASELAA
jgi:lipid-A-disaccharide synthase